MAIRQEIPERAPLEKVEVEYERPGVKETNKDTRARLLDINQDAVELASREAFPTNSKLNVTLHVKGVRDFLKLECTVKSFTRINVFKQPAFSVVLNYAKLTSDQTAKITWAEQQLVPRSKGSVRREDEKSAVTTATPTPAAAVAAATVVAAPEKPAEPASAPAAKREVKRPVALLQLIQYLDKFEVTDDLIMAVIEAAESGMDVGVLLPLTAREEAESEEQMQAAEPSISLPSEGSARPLNVYRLASNSKLYFSDNGLPVGPPVELFYLSRLKSPETCFAVELDVDSMTHAGWPSFRRGSILVFSAAERVADGDFAFLKVRGNDEFGQVYFDKDEVRIRPLNPEHREKVVRRAETKVICKLVGFYQDTGG